MELLLSGTSIDEEGAGQQQQQPAVLLDLRTQDRWWMVAVFCRSSLSPETPVTEIREERREVPCIVSSSSEDDCGQQQPGLSGVCWYQGPPPAQGLQTKLYKVTESRHIRYTYLIFCILCILALVRSGACEIVEDPDVSASGGRQSVMQMPAAVVSVSVSRMRILTLQMLIPSLLSRAPCSGARAGGVKRA